MGIVTDTGGGVRVRFAPSPTGFLHVGGARTAIFNWLFARNSKGKFLLRIEDTDPERSKSELSEQIINSLKWLGMSADEPVVYQSDNIQRYGDIIEQLIKSKKAYYDFETPQELEARRKEAEKKKAALKHDRSSLKLESPVIKKYIEEGKKFTVRFLVPEGTVEFEDAVHGKTSFRNSEIDDFIIQRSDGSPVYQIAVVVDDHDMGITHVIRGDDHLSNTPKQILLYNALGWELPVFAHLPMILDESKKKLSKRRDTVACEEYREMGYLPEALFNFLTLLGFSPPSSLSARTEAGWEIIAREELARIFSFERINRKPAVFDMKKLNWMNSEYLKKTDRSIIAGLLKAGIEKAGLPVPDERYIESVIMLMAERVSTINEYITLGGYFFSDPETYDEKGTAKYLDEETRKLIKEYLEMPENSPYDKIGIEQGLRSFAESKNIKPSKIIHPLRIALTGNTFSPGIFEVMELLGKETVKKRIQRLIEKTI